jgi:hypothetical protein
MSWEGEPYFRWVKMYTGTRHRVGCNELPITRSAWTKEGSAAGANAWWERKLGELQAAQLADHPHAARLKELAEYRDAAKALGEHRDAQVIDAEIVAVRDAEPDDAVDVPLGALLRAIKTQLKTGMDVTRLDGRQLSEMFGDERVWRDRAKRIRTEYDL